MRVVFCCLTSSDSSSLSCLRQTSAPTTSTANTTEVSGRDRKRKSGEDEAEIPLKKKPKTEFTGHTLGKVILYCLQMQWSHSVTPPKATLL